MDSSRAHQVTLDELVGYVDGEATASVGTHVASCSECARLAADLAQTQASLRQRLFRFDCPATLRLGEYAADLLFDPMRADVARHVLDCVDCADELKIARAFLSTDSVMSMRNPWQELRRIVATLLMPAERPLLGVARGGGAAETGAEYRAGPIKIVVGSVPSRRRGTCSVEGLIVHEDEPAEAIGDRLVRLSDPDGRTQSTRTDELGNFTLEDIAVGTYQLEVLLANEVVVVEGLPVRG